MSLTPEQIQLIRATVPVLDQHGTAITTSFYDTLLRENPALKNLFNQANQRNKHQASALAGALYAYASHIDDLGALAPAVEKMCQKHASLYIRPEQYDVVGKYLLRAMGDVLGSALTPEILEAWGAAYWQLANIMIKREEDILEHADGWTDWRDFRIANKVKESEEITSFYLKPVDGKPLPTFLPGQYISIMVEVPGTQLSQPRQYSLSDAPNPEYYRLSIKRESGANPHDPKAIAHPGWVSNVMHDRKMIGDTVQVSHPAGEFFCDPATDMKDHKPIVLISAGVGITPMISILNTIVGKQSKQKVSFIHGARTAKLRSFRQHIKETVAHHPNVKASIFVKTPDAQSDVQGVDYHYASRIHLGSLHPEEDLFIADKDTLYFVCGPDTFMNDMRKGLVGLGVDDERIRLELFSTGPSIGA